ncbi:MAG: CvpA family protein [Clostridia bacterium]|nr:CvpA family protein [Clostridia bacterium]
MSACLDIILIAIVVIFAILGIKRGFIKSVSGYVSHLIAFILTFAFYKRFTPVVKRLPFLDNMITDVPMPEFSSAEGFMEKIKMIINHIISSEDVDAASKAVMNNLLADVIATVISFAVLIIGFLLVLKLVFLLLELVAKAPVIKQANGVLGLLFGVLIGSFWAWIVANLFGNLLFPILNSKWPDIFMDDMLNSLVYKLCTDINPMTYIFMLLQKILG